jgi:hypothetical protein
MVAQVQNSGLARITSALTAISFWIGWGTGSGAAKTDNDLQSAAPEARSVATVAQGTTTVTNDKIVLTGTITATAARAITEFGAFDAVGTGSPPTGGNMDFYSTVGLITLNVGDSVVCTLNLTFS